jgi:molybdopterin/thiamine biosynthesis adenylyltransferase
MVAEPAGHRGEAVLADAAEPRFARHEAIPGWDQRRVAAATVVVAGAGALGNEVVKNLALAGVGQIVLCDPDVVEPTNLSRSALFRAADVGRPKARVLADAVSGLAPGTTVAARVSPLASGAGLGELADAAVTVGCLDSVYARLQLLGRCALVGASLVDGGTHPWGGEVRLRLRADEPCFGCTLTPAQRSVSDVPWSCADDDPSRPVPSSIVGTAIVAGWMTLAALRLILGDPPPFRLLTIDGQSGTTAPVSISRDPSCPYHHPAEGRIDLLPVRNTESVAALLAALRPDDLPLAWQPVARAGSRGEGPPGAPGAGGPMRGGTLSLREADPGAVLAGLGVPPEEILAVGNAEGGYRWVRLRR